MSMLRMCSLVSLLWNKNAVLFFLRKDRESDGKEPWIGQVNKNKKHMTTFLFQEILIFVFWGIRYKKYFFSFCKLLFAFVLKLDLDILLYKIVFTFYCCYNPKSLTKWKQDCKHERNYENRTQICNRDLRI